MSSRTDLQALFERMLGSRNVYYQVPTSMSIKYPAIVYTRNDIQNVHAGNSVYLQDTAYSVTVIDKNPDSDIVKAISRLPLCSFDRHYVADNLNHDVFTLYF